MNSDNQINARRLAHTLANADNLLIIQDLDGVCMPLVRDPLTRRLDPAYLAATRTFDGHFFVLTNGEHAGSRGVNAIVDRTGTAGSAAPYLPGLAAGGVQWQDRDGRISHPGTRDRELAFLARVPATLNAALSDFFAARGLADDATVRQAIHAAVLDNPASPTANLNPLLTLPGLDVATLAVLQKAMAAVLDALLQEAASQGLGDAFFVHLAPNLGIDEDGRERIRLASPGDTGTSDFQFMLRGARKEAGVLVLLNRYLARRTGQAPLGEDFNVRSAPDSHAALRALVRRHVDPAQMPLMVAVGDTVTSRPGLHNGQPVRLRGGSDRGFLQLVQDIANDLGTEHLVVYVDSSGGELDNRIPVRFVQRNGETVRIDGPGEGPDPDDPLHLDVVLGGGDAQYREIFCNAAKARLARCR